MSDRRLTNKQRLFVEAYLANPNGVVAARVAGYKGGNHQLGVIAAQNLAKLSIKVLIEKRVNDAVITADEILQDVRNIAKASKRDSDRLKAYEMLGKHLAMWTDKTELDVKGQLEVEQVIKPKV